MISFDALTQTTAMESMNSESHRKCT